MTLISKRDYLLNLVKKPPKTMGLPEVCSALLKMLRGLRIQFRDNPSPVSLLTEIWQFTLPHDPTAPAAGKKAFHLPDLGFYS